MTSATEAILPYLRKGNLVVLESTSPPHDRGPGEAHPGADRLESGCGLLSLLFAGTGAARTDPARADRERGSWAALPRSPAEAGCALYATFVKGEIVATDATTAEMVKLMENTSRDVNIARRTSSRLAEKLGVDVWEAIGLANRHPRINILKPGRGSAVTASAWTLVFVESAPELTPLIYHARQVNDQQPYFVLKKVQALGPLEKKDRRPWVSLQTGCGRPAGKPRRGSCPLAAKGRRTVKAWEPFKPDAPARD